MALFDTQAQVVKGHGPISEEYEKEGREERRNSAEKENHKVICHCGIAQTWRPHKIFRFLFSRDIDRDFARNEALRYHDTVSGNMTESQERREERKRGRVVAVS